MKTIRKHEIETEEFQIGDQITITLGEKAYTATAQQITPEGAIFMFDEYIAQQKMNEEWTNRGGFEASCLNKWMQETLLPMFPAELQPRIKNLTLPSVGQMFGHDNDWCERTFEPDTDEQFPLMKVRRNRVADFEGDYEWGWLKNATKESVSAAYFACVAGRGTPASDRADGARGVRPVFLLVR